MKSLRQVTVSLAVLLLASCAAVNKDMASWVGRHQSELIAEWGPPQSTASDGKGGTILMYRAYVNRGQTPGYIVPAGYGRYAYTAPQQQGYSRSRMFYVNSDGIIYAWRWQGL